MQCGLAANGSENPSYEKRPKVCADLTTYRFDMGMWKGRKAYIELLIGTYDKKQSINDTHRLVTNDSSYIEAAYAVAYTGEPPDMTTLDLPPRDRTPLWRVGKSERQGSVYLLWPCRRLHHHR